MSCCDVLLQAGLTGSVQTSPDSTPLELVGMLQYIRDDAAVCRHNAAGLCGTEHGQQTRKRLLFGLSLIPCRRGGYNSDDITKVGGGGGLLSQEAVMTE